jgi:hypothetical protein
MEEMAAAAQKEPDKFSVASRQGLEYCIPGGRKECVTYEYE